MKKLPLSSQRVQLSVRQCTSTSRCRSWSKWSLRLLIGGGAMCRTDSPSWHTGSRTPLVSTPVGDILMLFIDPRFLLVYASDVSLWLTGISMHVCRGQLPDSDDSKHLGRGGTDRRNSESWSHNPACLKATCTYEGTFFIPTMQISTLRFASRMMCVPIEPVQNILSDPSVRILAVHAVE